MDLNQFSPLEMAAFINSKKADDSFMKLMNEFLNSQQSVENDTYKVSASNSEVQTAPSEKSTLEDLFREVEVTNSFPKVEPALPDGKTKPTEKVIAVRKPKTFKPKVVVALDRKFHTIKEVADAFRISVSTLHKHLKDGSIEGFKLGNQWRFSQSQIDAFENRITSVTK